MNRMDNAQERATSYIEVADTKLEFRPLPISDDTPTGEQILARCDLSPRDEYVVLQWLSSGDLEELRGDETVNLKESGSEPARFIVAKADRLFRLLLDDRSICWPAGKIRASALRELGRIDPAAKLFLRREEVEDDLVADDAIISLSEVGVESFYSKREAWKLNVQGVVITSEEPTIRVRDALVEAGFDPEQGWIIVLKTSEAKKQVSLEEMVDLRMPGVEKLRLTPREINNGEASDVLRRDFQLSGSDEQGLANRDLVWETLVEGGRRWLLLTNYPLPAGLSSSAATIALEIPPTYPSAEIDMFYCLPHLALADGRRIAQTEARAAIRGQQFQRWSRHRGAGSPWKPGSDNVLTHLALIDAALLREIEPS